MSPFARTNARRGAGLALTRPLRRGHCLSGLLPCLVTAGMSMATPVHAASGTEARLQANWTQPVTGQEIRLDPSTSSPRAGRSIVRYDWDFGDGRTATSTTAAPHYVSWPEAARRKVTLTVTDSAGVMRSARLVIEVKRFAPTGRLNDSGIDWCAVVDPDTGVWTNGLNCLSLDWPLYLYWGKQQDGYFGRDFRNSKGKLSKVGSGAAGFDFTRLGADGLPLAIQDGVYSDTGNEADGTRWDCVRDNTTGLIWEVKRNDPSHLRHAWHTYSWYSTDRSNNGGVDGLDHGGECTGVPDPLFCNTQSYITAVNALPTGEALCGFRDWRLPTIDELGGLTMIGRANPAIDTGHFPNSGVAQNTQAFTWSSSTYRGFQYHAWGIRFDSGERVPDWKEYGFQVRLVRSGV
ncbi:MAG: DUF1566 domain-containing protein [Burkholderiales bacterium]|nr:DUF1566 domain-containing protein [Burkholderiales bacterium]